MSDLLQELSERIKALGADWTKFSVVGTFVLYVVGYLTLRFHLTALGLGTDLSVLDDRYLYTGARFVVFLLTSLPIMLFEALPLAALAWGAWHCLPQRAQSGLRGWAGRDLPLACMGIVFALLSIQLAMRQCFLLHDLLVGSGPRAHRGWLLGLLQHGSADQYFYALMALCVPPVAVWWVLRQRQALPLLRSFLGLLVAVQWLLLPINFGVLIVDKSFARVQALGQQPLAPGQQAWLVWEGKDGVTFHLRRGPDRSLLTLPRADVKRIEIVGFDFIGSLLDEPPGPRSDLSQAAGR